MRHLTGSDQLQVTAVAGKDNASQSLRLIMQQLNGASLPRST